VFCCKTLFGTDILKDEIYSFDRNGEVYVRRDREVQQGNIITSVVTNLMRWQRCCLLCGERI
jgi:hypothetical protein